jgi:hypothetical protein
VKEDIRGQFKAMSAYIKKSEISSKKHNNTPQGFRKTRASQTPIYYMKTNDKSQS